MIHQSIFFISWVSFLVFSIAMLLLSSIHIGYLGGCFGLVLIGLILLYSLGLIFNACSSSWSSALCFLTYFLAALVVWVASGWVFGRVAICVVACWSTFSTSSLNGNRSVCASSESIGVILSA